MKMAEALFSAINARNWEFVLDQFDENGSLLFPGTSPLSGLHEGKEMVRKYFRRMNIAVPNLTFTIKNIAESDKVVIIEWTNSGKTRKGGVYGNSGITVLEFSGGKIMQLRDYLDTEKLKS